MPSPSPTDDPTDFATDEALLEWIETLESSDRMLQYLMAAEVWALIEAMDDRFPGFWSRFMANRQDAMKAFVRARKAKQRAEKDRESSSDTDGKKAPSPKDEGDGN